MLPPEINVEQYPNLQKWVIGCLSGHKKDNDIIYQLCRRTGWDWSQAKRFVEQVGQGSQKEIHRRRVPLLLGIGLLMMVSGAVAFLSAFPDLTALLSEMEPPLNIGRIIEYIFARHSEYLLAVKLVTGMALFIGGGVGTWRAVMSAIPAKGKI
jgi:hypothetical protein